VALTRSLQVLWGNTFMLGPVRALVLRVLVVFVPEGVKRSVVDVAVFVVVDGETLCSIITLTITQM